MAESGKQNEPISGRRQGDASKCEMNRFGRVTPSAGRDVIDRRASFPSLLARAVVWLLELHVSRTILDQFRRRFSGHGGMVQERVTAQGWLGSTPEGQRPQIRGLRAGGALAVTSSIPATQLSSPARLAERVVTPHAPMTLGANHVSRAPDRG
jgi:hypothetical protein